LSKTAKSAHERQKSLAGKALNKAGGLKPIELNRFNKINALIEKMVGVPGAGADSDHTAPLQKNQKNKRDFY